MVVSKNVVKAVYSDGVETGSRTSSVLQSTHTLSLTVTRAIGPLRTSHWISITSAVGELPVGF